MTSRDLYAIGARLLALYFVVAGFVSLPSIYAAYEVAANSDTLSPPLYTLAAGSQTFTLILVGFVLLWMHKIPKGATFGSLRSETVLRVGLKLLGIFFAVSGLIWGH